MCKSGKITNMYIRIQAKNHVYKKKNWKLTLPITIVQVIGKTYLYWYHWWFNLFTLTSISTLLPLLILLICFLVRPFSFSFSASLTFWYLLCYSFSQQKVINFPKLVWLHIGNTLMSPAPERSKSTFIRFPSPASVSEIKIICSSPSPSKVVYLFEWVSQLFLSSFSLGVRWCLLCMPPSLSLWAFRHSFSV